MPFKVPGVNPRVKKIVEMTPLMLADETGGSDGVHFDTRSFDALTSTLGTIVRADARRMEELRETLDDEGVETMLMTKVLKALSDSVL